MWKLSFLIITRHSTKIFYPSLLLLFVIFILLLVLIHSHYKLFIFLFAWFHVGVPLSYVLKINLFASHKWVSLDTGLWALYIVIHFIKTVLFIYMNGMKIPLIFYAVQIHIIFDPEIESMWQIFLWVWHILLNTVVCLCICVPFNEIVCCFLMSEQNTFANIHVFSIIIIWWICKLVLFFDYWD